MLKKYMVEDMCERLGTNRKVLSQMMQRQYGIHFPEYLNNRRLEYAQQLLLTTSMKNPAQPEKKKKENHKALFFVSKGA